ncbi:MAG: hypothetical protein ABI797_06390, partial [Chloroflexota bacterium]
LIALLVVSAGVARSSIVTAEPAPLKAVFISGPTHSMTDSNKADSEALALQAEALGMDVRRVFHPNATWENVMAAVDGASLVVYMGHGYGWPSPYPPFREKFQNGLGLNPVEGGSKSDVEYHGGRWIRDYWHLAPNAIVFLNHLCYAAGNGEPGMSRPSYDLARQRVDNMASNYLTAGARAVFAYSWQNFKRALNQLFTTNMTVEEIFKTPGIKPRAYYGWIGENPRYFDSVRVPGADNLLDPDSADGYLRAVSGDLSMTAAQWRGEQGGTWSAPAFQATPNMPSGFGGTAYNNRWVRLSWQPVGVNYFGGATYTVFRNGKKVGSAGTATSFDNQPTVVGTYTYQVKSVDPAGFESALTAPITVQVVENAGHALPNSTPAPTASPTSGPTASPTAAPTATPTSAPSGGPTATPTASPTQAPVVTPSPTPSATPTAPIGATLLPPSGLQAVAQPDLKVAVSWNAAPSAVKYKMYRNGYLIVTTRNLNYLSVLWLPGRNKYQVQTVDAAGLKSAKSAAVWVNSYTEGTPLNVVDTTPPTAPTGLTAESLGNRQVRISWSPSTDTGPSPVGYMVMRGSAFLGRVSTPYFVDTPGKVGAYTYKITAFDGYGNLAPVQKVVGEAVL